MYQTSSRRFVLKDGSGKTIATLARPFEAKTNANTSVEAAWPVGADAPDYVAFAAELVLADGTLWDREPGAFVVWNEDVIAKGPKLTRQGSLLAIDGRPAFYMGEQTYWGQTRPTDLVHEGPQALRTERSGRAARGVPEGDGELPALHGARRRVRRPHERTGGVGNREGGGRWTEYVRIARNRTVAVCVRVANRHGGRLRRIAIVVHDCPSLSINQQVMDNDDNAGQ